MNRAGRFFLMQFLIIIVLLCCQTTLTVQAQITPWGRKSKAIEIAQNYMMQTGAYPYKISATQVVTELLKEVAGEIKSFGWKAENIEGQIYLVTYSFTNIDTKNKDRVAKGTDKINACFSFEVLIEDGIARYIPSDKTLEEKYLEKIKQLAFGDNSIKVKFFPEKNKSN